jgi:hypothetical protein
MPIDRHGRAHHAEGSPHGGRFAPQTRGDADCDELVGSPTLELLDRSDTEALRSRGDALSARLDQLAADLNQRRLVLLVDERLPLGVVRCANCGQFSSEESPQHDCPYPKLLADGYTPAWASRYAHAGFSSRSQVEQWGNPLEDATIDRAGAWNAVGIEPEVARILDAQGGIDPSDLLAPRVSDETRFKVRMANERIEDVRRHEAEYEIASRPRQPGDPRMSVEPHDPMDEILDDVDAAGAALADDIDRRLAVDEAVLRARITIALDTAGWPPEAIEQAWESARERGTLAAGLTGAASVREEGEFRWPRMFQQTRYGNLAEGHPARELVDDYDQLRTKVTIETLSEIRDFGGQIDCETTAGSKRMIADAAALLPADWIAQSNAHPHRLHVRLANKNSRQSTYAHRKTRRELRVERSEPIERSSTIFWPRGNMPTDAAIEDTLRHFHPEAFDEAAWRRKGKARGMNSALRSGRVTNIRDVRYDVEAQRLYYTFDKEDVRVNTLPGEKYAEIKTHARQDHLVHEMGHRFENTVPALRRLAAAWREFRWGERDGGTVESPLGFGRRGMVPDGGFITPYVGRTYASGDTEVTSMGMEAVLAGSYGGLVGDRNFDKTDAGHRHFILGVLASA